MPIIAINKHTAGRKFARNRDARLQIPEKRLIERAREIVMETLNASSAEEKATTA